MLKARGWGGLQLALTAGLCAVPALAQAPRGTPVLIELPTEVLPLDVGAGGFVTVGSLYRGGGFHWMPTSGLTPIGGAAATAVARDGKVIVGDVFDSNGKEQAAIWQGGKEWRLLGSIGQARPCDLNLSAAYDTSADGRVVVGLAWDGCNIARAFRWEEATGMVDLGSANSTSSRANAVSADGRIVVGWINDTTGFRRAARWEDRTQSLIQGPQSLLGEAHATNHDGSLVTGTGCRPFDAEAGGWRWTAATGVECLFVERPRWLVPRPYQTLVLATSDDGRVMAGSYSFGLDAEALVWFDGQPQFLRDYLRANGVPAAFEGWVNSGFVQAMTPDGRTLVGYGAGPKNFQGYLVVLPEMGDR